MSNIYFSHGDKGGVGKSLTAALLIDYLMSQGKSVALIEGDAGQPDIALRFAGIITVLGVNLNRAGAAEEAVIAFTEALEAAGDDVEIVVNLPAAAGDTLESMADVLVGAAESLGHTIRVFYSIGHTATATKNALQSIDAGLLSVIPAGQQCVVYPAFLGKVENFDWVKSGARDKYDGREIVMPEIKPEELAQKVLSTSGRFSGLVGKESPLALGERLVLQSKWLKPAMAAVSVFDIEKEGA